MTKNCKGKRNKVCDALSRFPVFRPEVLSDPWMDVEESYEYEMVNATVDKDIKEDSLLADILMAVQQDNSYREISVALRQGMSKDEVESYLLNMVLAILVCLGLPRCDG